MAESNLSSYEKAAIGQAILQRLNVLNDVLHNEASIGAPLVRDKVKQEYQTLYSAAHKLKINIDKEIEGLD